MILELQRAHGVRHFFQRVGLPMRVVVHGVNTPLIPSPVMFRMQDAVHHGIAHIQVRRSHIDFGTQHACAVGEFAGFHAFEQI